MRLIDRNDLYLLAALTVALFVVFSGPIARLLEYVRDIERANGLQLTPGLIILGGVFVFHQLRKRLEMRAEAHAAAAEARQARARANEMERLASFGRALARSLDSDSIRAAVVENLPLFAPGHTAWIMTRTAGHWHTLVQTGGAGDQAARQRVASRAIGEEPASGPISDEVCFPMEVGGDPIGVLGISAETPLTEEERRSLQAAAALLAVSIKNADLFREIHENSVRDSLTGCFNRRYTLEVLDAELRRARRSRMPFSLIMFDLDHFKSINDQYGHLCGDAVLTTVGSRMNAVLRGSDVKCRYGGEEFLILLPDTPLPGAERVADTLRRDLETQTLRWSGTHVPLTASFGVTCAESGDVNADAVIARADAALYDAKQEGRNCVRVRRASGIKVEATELSPAE